MSSNKLSGREDGVQVPGVSGPGAGPRADRTFGCVRVAWNRTLAWRRHRYHAGKTGTTYAQASAYLTAMKDLAVQNMVRNRALARAISDCGWGNFRAMVEYEAARAGRQVIVIDRWYPSSKTCSACGYVLADLSLGPRAWQCPCGRL
jgi:IS605 OrfB family transposase